MRGAERIAGLLALLSGVVHGGLGPEHFREWWGYGVFFAFAAACEAILGLALILDALDPAHPAAPRRKRILLAAGILGNLVLLAVYALTRISGIPLGPANGVIEEAGPLDLATQAAEALLVALLAFSLIRDRGIDRARP